MLYYLIVATLSVLFACDTRKETDSASAAPDAACVALETGTYGAAGSCFGMSMSVSLDMDEEACAFGLSDWSMSHGSSPEGGTVDGETVTLSGGDFEGCQGTAEAGAISGVCSDGCAWELVYAGR